MSPRCAVQTTDSSAVVPYFCVGSAARHLGGTRPLPGGVALGPRGGGTEAMIVSVEPDGLDALQLPPAVTNFLRVQS